MSCSESLWVTPLDCSRELGAGAALFGLPCDGLQRAAEHYFLCAFLGHLDTPDKVAQAAREANPGQFTAHESGPVQGALLAGNTALAEALLQAGYRRGLATCIGWHSARRPAAALTRCAGRYM